MYDALRMQYLDTMHVAVCMDRDGPASVVESYEFGFSYPARDGVAVRLRHESQDRGKASLRGQIQTLLRNLIISVQSLEGLPGIWAILRPH